MVSFFEMFRKPQIAESKKALIIRMLLIPILITSNSKGTFLEVVDSAIIETIDNAIWRPMSLESADVACDPSLVVELLQLTALLVQCGSQILNESKKDVIKFAWSYIKVDDITCKQAAYVVLARFFFEFTTPSKIIIQVFVALLRSHQAEVRLLVRQALDVLLPILPERIPTNANSAGTGSGLSIWVRWTRRVIIEDGHTSSQLVTIYQLITRHPSLFYDSRDAFIPQIVSSLSRLGLASVSTKETKSLTVDLAELILAWERQGESDPSLFEGFAPQTPDTPHSGVDMMHVDKKMKVGSSDATVVAPPGVLARSNSISSQPSNFREMLVTYLIRLITSTNELAQRRELVYRSISVFTDFLVLWRDVNIRFAPFERVSAMDVTDANLTSISNSLETLKVIVDAKDDAWLLSNLSSISKIIDPWMRCDNLKIIKGVEPIVYKIFGAIAEPIIIGSNPGVYGASSSPGAMNAAPEISPDYAAFIKMVDSIIKTNIQEAANTYATVAMLCSSYGQRKADLSSMYPDVVKLFQKCVRDHLTALATSNMEQTADSCHLLMMLLKLLKGRMSQMGDQRKYFLVALLSLVDKSTDSTLLKLLLSIVSEWVQCKTEAFPTAKEKANIMVKMIEFQNSSDKALFEDYLNLVADIYSDKSFLRTELAVRLEQAFLLGTKCTIPVIRSRFAKIFSNSIDENLVIRLNYVFGVQNWESISSSFWLRQALELLLDSAVSDIPIHSSSSYYR